MLKTLYIDGVLFHSNSASTDISIPNDKDVTGLDAPDYRINEYSAPGADGSVLSSLFMDGRTVSIPLNIGGADQSAYEAARRTVLDTAAPQRDAYGIPITRRVQITTLNDSTYFFDAIFRKPIVPVTNYDWTDATLICSVPDPWIYDLNPVASGQIQSLSGGGFLVPALVPFLVASSPVQAVTLNNPSSVPAWLTVSMYGTLTNPTLTNLTTNTVMKLANYTITSSDSVQFDMRNKQILLNSSSSLIYTKSDDSDWLWAQSGDNIFKLSSESAADTGYAVITFYVPRLGI